jgi:predicted nucleic acid-binding Zn ribbon protein
MEQICLHCGKVFEGNNERFCSENCRHSRISIIKKRLRDAMNKNKTTRI